MRKIRNAAVAGLAAVTLMAGTVAVATADDAATVKNEKENSSTSAFGSSDKKKDDAKAENEKENSSTSAFGSSDKKKDEDKKSDDSKVDDKSTTNTDGTARGKQEETKNWDKPSSEREAHENRTKCTRQNIDLGQVNLGDRDCETASLSEDVKNSSATNSSVWGDRYNADQDVTGRNLLGMEKNFSEQPVWAQIWYVVTILGVVGTVAGLVALPIVNQARFTGFVL